MKVRCNVDTILLLAKCYITSRLLETGFHGTTTIGKIISINKRSNKAN